MARRGKQVGGCRSKHAHRSLRAPEPATGADHAMARANPVIYTVREWRHARQTNGSGCTHELASIAAST